MKEDLLKKWLNDELTDAEKEAFSKEDDYAFNQQIIDTAKHFKASNFSKADDFETFKKNYEGKAKVKQLHWVSPLLKIASIVIIILGVYFTFFNSNNSTVEINTVVAEKTNIQLPDLSEVMLNADSKISYDKSSWESNRRLELQGEAYFKVAKGKTFDIITNNGTVTVVGTEFNVKSRNSYFEVNCYEGIVSVVSDTIERRLTAGKTFRILDEKFTQGQTIDAEPQWINNRSSFKLVTLKEVFKELERQYNVSVKFKNTDTSRLFSGGFVNDNLQNALVSITQPMNLTFEISTSNQVLIHGNAN